MNQRLLLTLVVIIGLVFVGMRHESTGWGLGAGSWRKPSKTSPFGFFPSPQPLAPNPCFHGVPLPPVVAEAPCEVAITPSQYAMPLPFDRGAVGLWQSLKKLHTRASLLMVVAHPDDEDGGMLTYEARGQGARVTLLTLNRGEGGANVMSPDYFDTLGLVRTEELLAAGRYYGVNQYWTRVVDYGFSKTKEEALGKWTHDRVLYDVVRVVRMTRPLVITSVFVGGPSDGHGNHQVAGQMAQEVFRAAGDPRVFPDQILAGLRPWSPLKDYARVPFFRREGQALSTNVEVPEGNYDPVLGMNYVQVSRQGLGFQKSQNGGIGIPPAGKFMSAYHRFGSVVPTTEKENSFFAGIDVSLMGIASLARTDDADFLKSGLREINTAVEDAMAKFSADHPENTAPALAAGLKATMTLIDRVAASNLSDDAKYDVRHELQVKKAEFNDAIAQALGISLLATVAPEKEPTGLAAMFFGAPDTFRVAIPGQTFKVKVHVVDQGSAPVTLSKMNLESPYGEDWSIRAEGDPGSAGVSPATPGYREDSSVRPTGDANGELAKDQAADVLFSVKVPQNSRFTRPYFTRPNIEQPYYDVVDPRYLNLPLAPYPLVAWAELSYEGVPIRVGQVIQTRKRVTGFGEILEPLVVGPAISVSISPRAGIVPLNEKSFAVTTSVHSNVKGPAKGTIKLELPSGWTSAPGSAEFSIANDGEDQSLTFRVLPNKLEEKPYNITAVAEYGGREYKEGYRTTGYPGLRPYYLYTPSAYRTSGVDVKVAPGLNVGYITGSGDEVPESLEDIGIKVHFLTSADLANADLAKYDVILMGVRTYAVREDLRAYNGRILDYVKNGGVVVVQYNTPEYEHNYGPYPYTMTNDPEEVTDEESKVDILDPAHPVFNWPNKITENDFRGWVEERGSKFMKSWDPHYEALLSTQDPSQEPQRGGLLYAPYGRGVYVYNAYAFYRQLPEGIPGAYRIFANLVSLPRNPQVREPPKR